VTFEAIGDTATDHYFSFIYHAHSDCSDHYQRQTHGDNKTTYWKPQTGHTAFTTPGNRIGIISRAISLYRHFSIATRRPVIISVSSSILVPTVRDESPCR
jgi:hypothetical protein